MDVGYRVMRQVQLSTSITLVRFLGVSLSDSMGAFDMVIFSALVLAITYVIGNEYVLSPLSRRLAVLLILEKVRPVLSQHIDDGVIFHVHGLMVNAGFLSLLAVVPARIRQSEEGEMLVRSVMYMYSDIFGFFAEDRSLHVLLLCCSFVGLALLSNVKSQYSSMFQSIAQILSVSFTYLVLAILQFRLDALSETALLQAVLIITVLHFMHLPGMEDVEDYMVYNVAGTIQHYIKSDPWYWVAALFALMQMLQAWVSLRSMAVQVLLLVVVNVSVATTITYIKQLAIHDTIITLKTSALVLQFVVNEMARRIASK